MKKVRALNEPSLAEKVSSQKPFGLATNFKGESSDLGLAEPVKLLANQKIIWVDKANIPTNREWVDKWKVLMSRIQGTSAAVETKFLSRPIVVGPRTACTETYIVAGVFDTEAEANRLSAYLATRFVRFLVSLRKPTQDALRPVYGFVPDIPLDRDWTDQALYQRYGLSAEEISFIESQVAPHDKELFDPAEDEMGDDV